MGYADWHFFWKDFEENKGFRRFILIMFGLMVGFLIFLVVAMLVVGNEGGDDDTLVVFNKHITPKVLQRYHPQNEDLDKAISELIAILDGNQKTLKDKLIKMQRNYQFYLTYNGVRCRIGQTITNEQFLQGAEKATIIESRTPRTAPVVAGTFSISNPYRETLSDLINYNEVFKLPSIENITINCRQ